MMVRTPHGDLQAPVFLPDATRAVVRSLDAHDLVACGIQGVVVNAFHLSRTPGSTLIASLGGIHAFMHWEGPIVTLPVRLFFQEFSRISKSVTLISRMS